MTKEILTGFKVDPDPQFVFSSGEKEMLRIAKGKFIVNGKELKDPKKIYERFCAFMNLAERKPITPHP